MPKIGNVIIPSSIQIAFHLLINSTESTFWSGIITSFQLTILFETQIILSLYNLNVLYQKNEATAQAKATELAGFHVISAIILLSIKEKKGGRK